MFNLEHAQAGPSSHPTSKNQPFRDERILAEKTRPARCQAGEPFKFKKPAKAGKT